MQMTMLYLIYIGENLSLLGSSRNKMLKLSYLYLICQMGRNFTRFTQVMTTGMR